MNQPVTLESLYLSSANVSLEDRLAYARHHNILSDSTVFIEFSPSPVLGETRLLVDPLMPWEDVERLRYAILCVQRGYGDRNDRSCLDDCAQCTAYGEAGAPR